MLTVHVRINDESTGKPVAAWLRITDAAGRYYPPLGRLSEFACGPDEDVGGQVRLGHESFAFIDGICEVPLPAGTLNIEVERGPEYTPVSTTFQLREGKLALRQGISRWTDWQAQGWYSGDVRAHHLSPQAAALEGAACGLSVVQVLVSERPPRDGRPGAMPGLLTFSGSEIAAESGGCQVAVNSLNTHPVLGSVALLNAHRPVFPLRFGEPGEDDWSIADWCDQCHRKTGLVVWPDLPRLTEAHPQGEALAALILGKIDAFEVGPLREPQSPVLLDYYRLLDCGMRPVLVGGSGKDSNATPLGAMRTYAQVHPSGDCRLRLGVEQDTAKPRAAEEANPQTGKVGLAPWIDAVRRGRTFITTAPLLALGVDGHAPGEVLRLDAPRRLRLRAEAHSVVPFEYVEVLVNGEVQVTKTASGNRTSAVIETEFQCNASAWIAAVCYSRDTLRSGSCVFAHTNPVFIEVPGAPLRPPADSVDPLLAVLAQTRAWIEREARCTPKQCGHLLEQIDAATAQLSRVRGDA